MSTTMMSCMVACIEVETLQDHHLIILDHILLFVGVTFVVVLLSIFLEATMQMKSHFIQAALVYFQHKHSENANDMGTFFRFFSTLDESTWWYMLLQTE